MSHAASDPAAWDFSCLDWETRLAEGRSLMPDLPLDPLEAARGIGMFNLLRLPDVTGQPMLRDAGADWFREVVGAVIGSVDETGRRHVREPFILVPKKNSKTTNGAALMLTAMLADKQPNQAYFLYGPTQEIAERAFTQAEGMINADADLSERLKVQRHIKTIRDLVTGSTLKVQTFDEKVATGGIVKGQLIDEVHILGKMAAAERILGQMRGNMLARPDSFMVKITTQSDEPPAGVFKSDLQLARGIRDGLITGAAATMLPILYELPESVQRDPAQPWRDSAMWAQVLPNLGRSLRLDLLEADFENAVARGPVELRRWCSQHLNIEIGLALHNDRWVGADYWEAAGDPMLTLEALIERSEVIVAGLDCGGLDDLVGMALIGRDRETQQWLHWGHAWAHDRVWERRRQIASRLDDFIAAGELTRVAALNHINTQIADLLERINGLGLFPAEDAIGFDRALAAEMVDEVRACGLSYDQTVAVPQGWQLSPPLHALERRLDSGTFRHGAQPMMDWVISNVRVERKGNNDLVTKQASGHCKIDPFIALLNAAYLMGRGPQAANAHSVYEARGMIMV